MAKKSKKTWHFLINVFMQIINYKKMYAIGTYTLNALTQASADPNINAILTAFTTPFQNFANKYSAWMIALAAKKAATNLFRGFLEGLHSQAEAWDVTIRGFHPRGTPAYDALMPNKLDPFTQGSYEQRLLAIKNLHDSIDDNDDDLDTLKTNVGAFYTNIDNARKDQQAKKDTVKVLSGDLKTLMAILSIALFSALGKLIGKFASDLKQVEHFFDLAKIMHRTKPTGEYDEGLTVPFTPGQIKSIPIQWTGDPLWEIENNGEGDAAAWLSETQNPTEVPDNPVIITAGDFAQKHASELGDLSKRYLCMANLSQILPTEINIVEVVE